MNKFKLIVAGFLVLITVAACDDGFKARTLLSEPEIEEKIEEAESEVETGETPESVDAKIQSSYSSKTKYMTEEKIEILDRTIKVVEASLEIAEHPGGASEELSLVKVKIQTACAGSTISEFRNTTIRLADLRSGKNLSVGTNKNIHVRLECTNSSCEELVAGIFIYGLGVNSPDQVALVGLRKITSSTVGNTTTSKYVRRHVPLKNFIEVLSFAEYAMICKNASATSGMGTDPHTGTSLSGTKTVIDPTFFEGQSVNSGGPGFRPEPSVKTVVDPSGDDSASAEIKPSSNWFRL